MTLDYERLKNWRFPDIDVVYGAKETMLYALGLNLGADPLDARQLRFTAARQPAVLPTMAATLGRLGPWMRAPETGIDYGRILVGEVSLTIHRSLRSQGRLLARHRMVSIHDKGPGRGALVTVARDMFDGDGALVAVFEQTTFCRGDGGFSEGDGQHDPLPAEKPTARPDRAADEIHRHSTLPQQALIYRLTGDFNPLHSDPQAALKAGFERPILHGLATFGMAGWAILDRYCDADPARLGQISCRMSAPVTPGSVLETHMWRDRDRIWFETTSDNRTALTRGTAALKNHNMGTRMEFT